jgi:hypothetical protein
LPLIKEIVMFDHLAACRSTAWISFKALAMHFSQSMGWI